LHALLCAGLVASHCEGKGVVDGYHLKQAATKLEGQLDGAASAAVLKKLRALVLSGQLPLLRVVGINIQNAHTTRLDPQVTAHHEREVGWRHANSTMSRSASWPGALGDRAACS